MSDGSIRRLYDVQDPAIGDAGFDYSDGFELTAAATRKRTPESLARAALEDMPRGLRSLVIVVHRRVLRFRLAPSPSKDHVLGWHIVDSADDHFVLEADGPVMRGVMVGRKTAPSVVVLKTFVFYRQPKARLIWRAVGPLHRTVAPYLLRRAARELT